MHNPKLTVVAACGVLWLAGCGPREEQRVVVQQPAPNVIEKKTVIKPVPQDKTIIVKPAPKPPQAKTDTKVNVKVVPESTPSTPAAPASQATLTPKPKPTVRPQSATTTRPLPTPRPTSRPRPKPTAIPARASAKNAALVVRAEIVSTSKVPDPKTVAYKDSIVFIKYKVLMVQSGTYEEKELLAAHWGMKNKKLLPAARYQIGQVQSLQLEPLDKRPELESLQRNDDTGEFDLEPYWVKTVS